MKKINFEAGTKVSPAKVTIDNVEHEVTPAVWEGNTPLSPFVLNKMQDNIEEETKTTQTTEVSEALTIENCAPVSAKLDIVSGKSIQEGESSPDNIIPIRNVGDNINIFNKDTMIIKNNQSAIYSKENDILTIKPTTDLYSGIYLTNYRLENPSPNGKITISFSAKADARRKIRVGFNTENENMYIESEWKRYSIVLNESINAALSFYSIENSSVPFYLTDIKLEFGETPTPYTPYNCGSADFQLSNEDNSQSRIVSFPFTEGQRLHIGDYLASDGTHHKRKTYVFTGTETFTKLTNYQYYTNIFSNDIKNMKVNNAICSHFTYLGIKNSTSSEVGINAFFFNMSSGTDYTNGNTTFVATSFSTIDEFKTFLTTQYANGTPVTIEYDLAEEEIIPYTTEQEQAHYELQHLLMYEGYTSIECIDEIKPDIQLTYWYNNELNKSYGERFDKVEDSINELEKGEIYSTEEQEIGKWIDGKPLYRRTIILDKPSSIEISNINEYNLLYDNDSFWSKLDFAMIDKTHSFILSNTVNNFNNATLTQGISGTQNENWWFDLRSYNKVNKTIQVCIGQTLINRFWKIYATLEYTKTTD